MTQPPSTLAAHDRYTEKPYRGSSHWWVYQQLESLPTSEALVDIGAGSGCVGSQARNLGFCSLFAVEIDPQTREHLAPTYTKVEDSIDRFAPSTFATAVLLDVLEHVPDPERMLKEVLTRMQNNGVLFISVPNIAHWSIRLMLLFGYFPKMEKGPLDRTHLHFFTLDTMRDFLGGFPELRVEEVSVSIAPYELLLPKWVGDSPVFELLRSIRLGIARRLPRLFGYQLLFRIRVVRPHP
jgi:SAM-dependent methyltransferase